ncbi:MAG: prephenate dehydrogenase/arogenate dehydrogenase family protein [Anaerolineae bacterium]
MATVTIAILGLGRIGASMVLALRRYNAKKDARHTFEVTSADLRAGIREDAAKVGLGDKIERDLFSAARDKDIVVLALPLADMQDAYRIIGPELRAGTVVLDTSPLKMRSLDFAKKYLGADVHMVGITPVINPAYLFDGLDDTLHAQADLFDKGSMLLMPSPSCAKEAVELASDLAGLLGAAPHFFDPAEHDSLTTLTEGMPSLLSVASFYMMARTSGWGDAQRITNPAFGRLTRSLYDTHPDDLRDLWLHNRESLVRHTGDLIAILQTLRELLAQNDVDALEAALGEASDAYNLWINRRTNGKWDDDKGVQPDQSVGNMLMSGFMGGYLAKRLQGGKNGKS